MTAYLSSVALAALDQAQTVIDRHIVSCAVCGTNQPCPERLAADQGFARYQRLPCRKPGVAVAGRTDGPGFRWLASA